MLVAALALPPGAASGWSPHGSKEKKKQERAHQAELEGLPLRWSGLRDTKGLTQEPQVMGYLGEVRALQAAAESKAVDAPAGPVHGSVKHSRRHQRKSTRAARKLGDGLVPEDSLPGETSGHQATNTDTTRHRHPRARHRPPAALLSNFTLNGAMALEDLFMDDRGAAGCWSVGGRVDCSSMSEGKTTWTSSWVTNWTNLVRSVDVGEDIGQGFQTGTQSLRKALLSREDEIRRKHAVIVGSEKPWFEAVALASGVDRVTTINFEPIATDHPQLETLTVAEARERRDTYDLAISICSVIHDGLGRFGDPLDPAGDLRAMRELFDLLKPGGLLFLAVPIGHDTLVWNAHRIYGRVRLPLLFSGWEQVSSVGFNESDFDRPIQTEHAAPAVFVLRRPPAGKARHAAVG